MFKATALADYLDLFLFLTLLLMLNKVPNFLSGSQVPVSSIKKIRNDLFLATAACVMTVSKQHLGSGCTGSTHRLSCSHSSYDRQQAMLASRPGSLMEKYRQTNKQKDVCGGRGRTARYTGG